MNEERTEKSTVGLVKRYSGDRCRLSLIGELRHGNTEGLSKIVFELYESGCSAVLLDLSEITYCESSGLQSLVQVYKYVQSKPGLTFRVYAPNGTVMESLKTSRFDGILQVTQDPKELEGYEEAGRRQLKAV